MQPTLENGQRFLASISFRFWKRLGRGDIVVFRHHADRKRIFVKRIIGLPNEDIRIENGQVYIEGIKLVEGYVSPEQNESVPDELRNIATRNASDNLVNEWFNGPDEYFLMGDNRRVSQDSRFFGPVQKKRIIGRVWFRIWPLKKLGPISIGR